MWKNDSKTPKQLGNKGTLEESRRVTRAPRKYRTKIMNDSNFRTANIIDVDAFPSLTAGGLHAPPQKRLGSLRVSLTRNNEAYYFCTPRSRLAAEPADQRGPTPTVASDRFGYIDAFHRLGRRHPAARSGDTSVHLDTSYRSAVRRELLSDSVTG